MKYEVPFMGHQLKYIFEQFKDAKIIRKDGDIVYIELELKYSVDIVNLFHAGARWGIKL